MLICEPRKIVSNVDRMAYEHLLAAGIIHHNKAGRPRTEKKIPKSRVGWKKLGPMRSGFCVQCGDNESQVPAGLPKSEDPNLCDRCFAVLANSRRYWMANEDFPNAG